MGRKSREKREGREALAAAKRLNAGVAQTYVPPRFPQGEGVNPSERFLSRLARGTFLTFWSFPNLYARDAGQTKEVCDLFVLFEDHLIVFSDKESGFSASGELDVSWKRWWRVA